jgi:vacuolar protein sorting-associated protein 72
LTDEEDVFDSDFGSTSSGSEGDDDEAGEKSLAREEKAARKVSYIRESLASPPP